MATHGDTTTAAFGWIADAAPISKSEALVEMQIVEETGMITEIGMIARIETIAETAMTTEMMIVTARSAAGRACKS